MKNNHFMAIIPHRLRQIREFGVKIILPEENVLIG